MLALSLRFSVYALALAHRGAARCANRVSDRLRARARTEHGQTSAEYALVLLGAASIAVLVAMWARKSNSVGKLLDAVFAQITEMMA